MILKQHNVFEVLKSSGTLPKGEGPIVQVLDSIRRWEEQFLQVLRGLNLACSIYGKLLLNGVHSTPGKAEQNLCGLLILRRQRCESTLNLRKIRKCFGCRNWHLQSYYVHYSAPLLLEILILGLICSFDGVLEEHIFLN